MLQTVATQKRPSQHGLIEHELPTSVHAGPPLDELAVAAVLEPVPSPDDDDEDDDEPDSAASVLEPVAGAVVDEVAVAPLLPGLVVVDSSSSLGQPRTRQSESDVKMTLRDMEAAYQSPRDGRTTRRGPSRGGETYGAITLSGVGAAVSQSAARNDSSPPTRYS